MLKFMLVGDQIFARTDRILIFSEVKKVDILHPMDSTRGWQASCGHGDTVIQPDSDVAEDPAGY